MPGSATLHRLQTPPGEQPSLAVRLRERLQGRHLDHELARGVHPGSSSALALHARRLLSPGGRERIAAGLEEATRRAGQPIRSSAQVPLRRAAILEARPELESLAAELRTDDDCRVRGVALARLLLTDGASPLYGPGPEEEDSVDELLAAVRRAYRALRIGEP